MFFVSFEKHAEGVCALPADLRSACYRAVLAEADEETFQRFLRLYRAADLHEEKDRISRALGAVRDPQLLRRVLDFAISVRSTVNCCSLLNLISYIHINYYFFVY